MNRLRDAAMGRRIGVALVAVMAGGTQPICAADRFEDVRQFIRTELVEQALPSIAVAVAVDGRIVWEQGFGWADRERRILADEHTSYSLASISKPITATGLMTLVQAGRIDLDKPVNDYLGNAKLVSRVGEARDATVRATRRCAMARMVCPFHSIRSTTPERPRCFRARTIWFDLECFT